MDGKLQPQVNAGRRFMSMVMDHIVMSFVVAVIVLPGVIMQFAKAFEISHDPPIAGLPDDTKYVMIFAFTLYMCKDIIGGRSLAKRALGLVVVNHKTDLPATPFKSFLRNITGFLWPMEALLALVSPARRLGDLIAGTRVAPINKELNTSVKWNEVIATFGFCFVVIGLIIYPFGLMMDDLIDEEDQFVEASYNQQLSEELGNEFQFTNRLVENVEFKVFDETVGKEGLFVSCLVQINGPQKDQVLDQVHRRLKSQLSDKFDIYNGHIKVFQSYKGMTTVGFRSLAHSTD